MSELPRSFLGLRLPGIGRTLTPAEIDQLNKYLNLLIKWQKTHRLVGSVEPAWVAENVVLDSLCFLEALPTGARRIADLGSGAGIPGVPMAIVRTDLHMSLIEARQRRASFLSAVVRELALTRVTVVASRAEAAGDDLRGRFDAAVMRCAGTIDTILAVALDLVRAGGAVVVAAHPSTSGKSSGDEFVIRTPTGTLRTFHLYTKPGPPELEFGR